MIETNDKLIAALYHTRNTLVEACSILEIDPKLIDIESLEVQQCMECDFWEKPKYMVADVCRFCNDMPDLRF